MKKIIILAALALIIQTGVFSQCLPDGITFTTQEQIDNFQTNYPGCSRIEGDVLINGDNIVNLNGLEPIFHINGDLIITRCNSLENLVGLGNLDTIMDEFNISYNASLFDLQTLGNLKYTGYLTISTNNSLQNLLGFEGLLNVGNSVSIIQNINLLSLAGIENLVSVGHSLTIQSNALLENLTGLENIISVGILDIDNNESFTSLSGLNNLSTVYYSLGISHNNSLLTIDQIGNLTEIGGLNISYNENLNSIAGLANINKIRGFVDIVSNDKLSSLYGLENITTIEGPLFIRGNDVLTDISGLINVTAVDGSVRIFENNELSSLFGLDNINYESINDLNIYSNPHLSICEVQSICNYLGNSNGSIYIVNNANGCNSEEEVQIACETLGIQQLNSTPNIFFYPNPASNEIFVTNKEKLNINEVNVYSQLGTTMLHSKGILDKIDVSTLNQGLYIIEFVTDGMKHRDKLLIE
ncbi:MAG: T9SS type A sorting domain-containing protein [Bacteroidales bacterium]|nr:T9SS type A sorting domain-containing protein [Bacteroidales bacterium]